MADLPSLATGMALHVRVRDIADAGAFDAMPSIATSSVPAAIAMASVQARGSTSLSGAWLLDSLDVPSAETARASRLSDMVLQRARQGRRFA